MNEWELFRWLRNNLTIEISDKLYISNSIDIVLKLTNPRDGKTEIISQSNVYIPTCSCDREGYY